MLCLQTEKCFCAKGDKCPSIGEAVSSDRDSNEKVKVCMVSMCLYICFVFMWFWQDKKSVGAQKEEVSSGDRGSRERAKVCGVLL